MNNDIVLEISLGSWENELDQTNFSILYLGWATSEVGSLFVNENEAINELAVVYSASKLLRNMDVSQVDVSVLLNVNNLEDCIHSHRGKQVGVLGNDFAAQWCDSVLDQNVTIV